MTTPTIAYLDCFAGISGDMMVGALLDAGLPEEILRQGLNTLDLCPLDLAIRQDRDGVIAATSFTVTTKTPQPARDWRLIRELIHNSQLSHTIKECALAIFTTLARAEAKIHGCPEDEVHFHEVGGVDSIIDIVGTALGFDFFGIKQLVVSPLPMPSGMVDCAHGRLPLPAPAVCEILKNVPVYGVDLDQEMVTPTGAAIVKSLANRFGPYPSMTINQVGYGRGNHRFPDRPNLLRLVLGKSEAVEEAREVEVIETNLDDWSPEGYPFLTEKLYGLGALDVLLIPAQMKKGRPGFLIKVITRPGEGWEIKRCLLSDTSAIGVRSRIEQRWTLPRRSGTVSTPWGHVQVKEVQTPTGLILTPEYEDCRRLALAENLSLQEVYRAVTCCDPTTFRAEDGE
ncbi:MAG: nickel pincer cofactor biosynthesis protein LarC [Proteobacteria bacterium]|nr:nickel pincer cofactor biosynthesis protein LarC [Pseudomonadota bacterium]MBU1686063.1 nickel pincer cofactor biosynthesis protein LarC [Pseudomonadota bacterium]